MKKIGYIIAIISLLTFWCRETSAQNQNTVVIRSETRIDDTLTAEQISAKVDSIRAARKQLVDSTLFQSDIFSLLQEFGVYSNPVQIDQPELIRDALYSHIRKNRERTVSGFRIRIFFDNSQSSRIDSEKTENLFIIKYPDIPTYRTYTNPYFKVTVGDFRTKSDAMRFLERIKGDFPGAFVVKEKIFQ